MRHTMEATLLQRLGLEAKEIKVLVGILAWEGRAGNIVGNKKLFEDLQKNLIQYKGISYIMTPNQSLDEHEIDGYLFIPKENIWIQTKLPIPNVIYNRVPYYQHEKSEKFEQFKINAAKKGIPFFNSSFLDKWSTYQLLSKHQKISNYLPDTTEVKDHESCYQFLKKYKCIYAKPKLRSKGFGVMRIRLKQDGKVYCETTSTTILFANFSRFWERFYTTFEKNQYIFQKAIEPKTFKGRRFDLRILGQFTGSEFNMTGIGVRQSFHQEVTTHIPKGGRIIPFSRVTHLTPIQQLEELTQMVGEELNKAYGVFYEFSIDIGLDEQKHPYIFEVNAKPMTFDEDEIESKRMKQLCHLFIQLYEEK
ncbi:YheC/D-like protein [Bacillus oleivorans]|uniref:YheC/D-like protein n=1 Tax=Bacillus oleivorans TaxID=1448271 RepID=A0A285CR40_9BACI|nr:YheC/YheD family protein [Bacillus oleivorans]SNX69991.1 YheC/D-like protein [Bacillus oleivorans]